MQREKWMRNGERENFAGVDFCGTVTVLTCEFHNFWVKVVKTKPKIWAKHVIEWVKKKLENKICDMSYKFELWEFSFKNWVLSHQQTKKALSFPRSMIKFYLEILDLHLTPCKGFKFYINYQIYFIMNENINFLWKSSNMIF